MVFGEDVADAASDVEKAGVERTDGEDGNDAEANP